MKTIRQLRREAKRLFRFCLVNNSLDENRARRVMRKIIETRRRGSLTILSRFLYLARLERARHTAQIESATALSAELRAEIRTELARTYGDITAVFSENPELIGGMRVKVGSDVYDGSVRGTLAALERSF